MTDTERALWEHIARLEAALQPFVMRTKLTKEELEQAIDDAREILELEPLKRKEKS